MTQGLLACLYRKIKSGKGGLVEVSMMESISEFQFESITTYYHDGGQPLERTKFSNAHPLLGAPYGLYQTADGYLALAMGSIPQLGELLKCDDLLAFQTFESWFDERDEIKEILKNHLVTATTKAWLAVLEPADIWCADVLTWDRLFDHEAFKVLQMIQEVQMSDGYSFKTTRCPIRINNAFLTSELGTPKLGEHTSSIDQEFALI